MLLKILLFFQRPFPSRIGQVEDIFTSQPCKNLTRPDFLTQNCSICIHQNDYTFCCKCFSLEIDKKDKKNLKTEKRTDIKYFEKSYILEFKGKTL